MGQRSDWYRHQVQLLRALALDYSMGCDSTVRRAATRADVHTRTVKRHTEETGFDHLWNRVGDLVFPGLPADEAGTALLRCDAVKRRFRELLGSLPDPHSLDGLSGSLAMHQRERAVSEALRPAGDNLREAAAIATNWYDSTLAAEWASTFEDFVTAVHACGPLVYTRWEQRIWYDAWDWGPSWSIAGYLKGRATALELHASKPRRPTQPVPYIDLDADVPAGEPNYREVREALAVVPYAGEWFDPGALSTKQGSIKELFGPRTETEASVAGLLAAGALDDALTFIQGHYDHPSKLPVRSRANLMAALGAGLLGHGAVSGADVSGLDPAGPPMAVPLEPDDESWSVALQISRLLSDKEKPSIDSGLNTDAVRFTMWREWVMSRGEPPAHRILDEAPLVLGANSIRHAVSQGKPWTRAPDLIPLIYLPAREEGYLSLSWKLEHAAVAVLRDPVTYPLPIGLRTALVAIADAYEEGCDDKPPARKSDTEALTRFRVAAALGEKLPDNVVREVREIILTLPDAPRLSVEAGP